MALCLGMGVVLAALLGFGITRTARSRGQRGQWVARNMWLWISIGFALVFAVIVIRTLASPHH